MPFEAIRDAVAREIDRGAKEIVLTGVDITDYDGGLGKLCQRLLAAEPRLTRLRLSSLDSIEIDGALFELIAGEPRLMPHFHLIAAGRRRHDPEADEAASQPRGCGSDRRADQGRPSRTPRSAPTSSPDFQPKLKKWHSIRLKLLDDCDIVAAHIFPFSPRPSTPAARMPQLAPGSS